MSLLHAETLHLAVNIFDRYCSFHVVDNYNLLGCVTLLIAAKYCDDRESAQTLRLICCSLCADSDLTRMEWYVLQELDWEVGHPTVADFQRSDLIISAEALCHPLLIHLSSYLAYIVLYHKEFISVRPSILSSCTLALAHDILKCQRPTDQTLNLPVCEQIVNSLLTHLICPPRALFNRYVRSHSSPLWLAIELHFQERMMQHPQVVSGVPIPMYGLDIERITMSDMGILPGETRYVGFGSCRL